MPATHTFVEQLRQARDATHSKNHPYFRKWAQGDLTKKQMGFYLVMHYHFVTEYLNWLAHMWAHCPVEEVFEVEEPLRALALLVVAVDAVHQVERNGRLTLGGRTAILGGPDAPVLRPLDLGR